MQSVLFDRPATRTYAPELSLVEKYRPTRLRDIVGQDSIVAALSRFVAKPYSTAFLLTGATGVGKTTAALALAREIGCVTHSDKGEYLYDMGGLHILAAGSLGVDEVRNLIRTVNGIPFYGSGFHCVIVNEVDFMTKGAEPILLDFLESLPANCVFIFSTNAPDKLSQRFKDRCDCLAFESGKTPAIIDGARQLIRRICEGETGSPDFINPSTVPGILIDGHVSFRRLVQNVAKLLRDDAARAVAS